MNLNSKVLDYLKLKLEGFGKKGSMYLCPKCLKHSASVNNTTHVVHCVTCNHIGGIYSVVKLVEKDKVNWKPKEVRDYLMTLLKIPDTQNPATVVKVFKFYKDKDFDLTRIARNDKKPIEKNWTAIPHKEMKEWGKWYNEKDNIGLKTGEASNITVVDFENHNIPEVFKQYSNNLIQQTRRGFHYLFKYEPDLPNYGSVEIPEEGLDFDILGNGRQVVIFPSVVDDVPRVWVDDAESLQFSEVPEMSEDIKKFLLEKLNVKTKKTRLVSTPAVDSSAYNDFSVDGAGVGIDDGNRHQTFMHIGGILRKQIGLKQMGYVLKLFNDKVCNPPMSPYEIERVVDSLSTYTESDDLELAGRIIDYLKIAQEANINDLKDALNEKRDKLTAAVHILMNDGVVYRSNRFYKLIEKVEWRTEFLNESEEVGYSVPYFNDCAVFRNGDMVVVGGMSGQGKSHVAMNMIKQFHEQGQLPYYITLESGNRFATIAQQLGLVEGSFKWAPHTNPQDIEIEEKAITIIDWILPDDYTQTDKLFGNFNRQLEKKGGLLIIFVQLRKEGTFFAKNMIDFFPSFVCKFIQEDGDYTKSNFIITKIRELRDQRRRQSIPCVYNHATKLLTKVEDIAEEEVLNTDIQTDIAGI